MSKSFFWIRNLQLIEKRCDMTIFETVLIKKCIVRLFFICKLTSIGNYLTNFYKKMEKFDEKFDYFSINSIFR